MLFMDSKTIENRECDGNSIEHNREVSKQNWKHKVWRMSYKAKVKLVSPKSSTCPMWRRTEAPKGKG